MTVDQHRLRAEVRGRIRAHRPDLLPPGPAGPADLLAAQRAVEAEASGTVVVAVVRRLDLAALIDGVCGYAAALPPAAAGAWRRSFTRTVFLAGNPANLAGRCRFAHVGPGGDVAWTGPDHPEAFASLRRLLKAYAPAGGPTRIAAGLSVRLPAGPADRAPRCRDLYLATAGTAALDHLVDVHHLLAEAVLDGLVGPGDRLTVRPVPRLVGVPGPFLALRVGVDPAGDGRLRARAGLTPGAARA